MLSVSSLSAVFDSGPIALRTMNNDASERSDGVPAAARRQSNRIASLLSRKAAVATSGGTTNSSLPRRNYRIPKDGDSLVLYRWPQPNGPLCLLQHQLIDFLGFKSFKRKYNTGLSRRKLESKENLYLVSKRLLLDPPDDLSSVVVLVAEEVLALLEHDFPKHYQILSERIATLDPVSEKREFCPEPINHQCNSRQVNLPQINDASVEEADSHLASASSFNSALLIRRRQQCKCFNLQTMQINYPMLDRCVSSSQETRIGAYPVALVQGQFFDGCVRRYSSSELFRLPLGTVINSQSATANEPAEITTGVCPTCQQAVTPSAGSIDSIRCSTCNSLSHINCLEMDNEMLKVALTYDWQCINCKICSECSQSSDEEMMMFCDRCDRGFHTYCVGLRLIPEGSWTCQPCLQGRNPNNTRKNSDEHSGDPPSARPTRKRQREGYSPDKGSPADRSQREYPRPMKKRSQQPRRRDTRRRK